MINTEKAKEILELNLEEGGKRMPPDVKEALAIAIMALGDELERLKCHPN